MSVFNITVIGFTARATVQIGSYLPGQSSDKTPFDHTSYKPPETTSRLKVS